MKRSLYFSFYSSIIQATYLITSITSFLSEPNIPFCNHVKKRLYLNSNNKFTNTVTLFVGGDYAGLIGEYNMNSNQMEKLPENLLPSSFVEWGEDVYFMELLTSEEENQSKTELERIEIKVLPEAGCGVDNLETLVKTSLINTGNNLKMYDKGYVHCTSLLYQEKRFNQTYLEISIFNSETNERIRIELELTSLKKDSNPPLILARSKTIKFIIERRTSEESSKGSIIDGGGLDGRTVSRLVGSEITQRSSALFEGSLESYEDPDTFNLPCGILLKADENEGTIQLSALLSDKRISIVHHIASQLDDNKVDFNRI